MIEMHIDKVVKTKDCCMKIIKSFTKILLHFNTST